MMKEMKKYLNSIQNLDFVDQNLTENLSSCSLVHTNDEFRKIVENYHSVTTQVKCLNFLFLKNKLFI